MSRHTSHAGRSFVALLAACSIAHADARAQSPTTKFGGFVDAYYAWDFGRPLNIQRAYTTQAARSGEFNINLAFVDAVFSSDRVRGRLALQAGTSVAASYADEPANGDSTASLLSRHIQEAVVGLRLGGQVWMDAGIFLSHTGSESWISRDNPTYTRSMVAENAPYYESGVKLTWQPTSTVSAVFALVNGWGLISETNGDKSIGTRIDWQLSSHISTSYYNLIGNEQPDTASARLRVFNGLSVKWTGDALKLIATVDGGRQNVPGEDAQSWWGAALIAQLQFSDRFKITARGETFADQDSVLIFTGEDQPPFRASGGSIGFDMTPAPGVLWRTEMRVLRSPDAIFIERASLGGRSKTNQLLVTSFAVSF